MARFSRDAAWLRALFPPTGTPRTQQPSAVSDDIQLTEVYTAGGQVALPNNYWLRFSANNPGPNARVLVIDPQPADPEVWRIFFMSLEVDTGPAAIFSGNLYIINTTQPTPFSEVIIQKGLTVGATDALATPWDVRTPVIIGSSGVDQSRNQIWFEQTSSQAGALEGLIFRAYIQRNPRGSTHYL